MDIITPSFSAKLCLIPRATNVSTQKIDNSLLVTYNMIVVSFSLYDSQGKVRFLEEMFLLAETSIKVVLGIVFQTLNNINIQFEAEKLGWKS